MAMGSVTSKDGTTIAFDRTGEGPPVVLLCGGSVDHTSLTALATNLSERFDVLNVHRRGRGQSGDTQPYAVQREVEDVAAVTEAAGGSAHLFGSSSGAVLALEAALQGVNVDHLALWEPPYIPEGDQYPRPPADQVEQYDRMIAEGRRGDAAEYFMTKVIGMPQEFVAQARSQPWWPNQEALAHTLAYDARIMGDYVVPVDRVASLETPTAVIAGGADFPWMRPTATALAEAMPNGETRFLEGQGHDVDQALLAELMTDFFAGGDQ
jgi:pimeloyl-ACP methyl ester carboxylesterase